MEFNDLPPEVILMIFSYLPHEILEGIMRVSRRWMQLASDPSLFTTLCIDPWFAANPQRVRKTLERSTMLHSLYITTEVVDWDIIASASTGFRLLTCLVIPGSGLSHSAMPAILGHCEILTTIVLWGRYRLAAIDVRTLESLRSLKRLVTSDHLEIHDDALYQICRSCPRLERLELNLQQISRSNSWTSVKGLIHLRRLSVSVISTVGLIQVSNSCPGLVRLEIGSVWNESDISMAQALQGFLQLKSLRVIHGCGEWLLNRQIRTPPLLERFEVPRLETQLFYQLMLSFRKTLRHVPHPSKQASGRIASRTASLQEAGKLAFAGPERKLHCFLYSTPPPQTNFCFFLHRGQPRRSCVPAEVNCKHSGQIPARNDPAGAERSMRIS
ncbi:hypothetical protein HPB48_001141 [Haemaphysalis longicornis]|uniref:F-box domain-containing protein n=1 Tax=Haemaphysalis longicornis TaxID=44386 RepID=A0A9J6FI74_HAELO|nr:hypothetical protein HPB48_001141 [Haemaphysalis longicornis]